MQQPPVGAGAQSVLEHATPAPRQVPCWLTQFASVVWTQVAPAGEVMQHAPVGVAVGQGVLQLVPGPRKKP